MATRDDLCEACAKIDLFSLFTGPRYSYPDGGIQKNHAIGTLRDVASNSTCPLCRLLKHVVYDDTSSLGAQGALDGSKVRCYLRAFRADFGEEVRFENPQTRHMLATMLYVYFEGTAECSAEEAREISRHSPKKAIKLLSPDSIDPARPLWNGFRATTMESSMLLLSRWIRTCCDDHKETCDAMDLSGLDLEPTSGRIRFIDARTRFMVEQTIENTEYAALSYVWGEDAAEYMKQAAGTHIDSVQESPDATIVARLPDRMPKVIDDAILVCVALGIPYLWVDLYCVAQNDAKRKAAEIETMGYIYYKSLVTLVDGHEHPAPEADRDPHSRVERRPGLLPADMRSDFGRTQTIETIHGRKYVTMRSLSATRLFWAPWRYRSWTYQEGMLARRIALFSGDLDIYFMCGAGIWAESLHSGPYGHRADLSGTLDLRSAGNTIIGSRNWLRDTDWKFEHYEVAMSAYSCRKLTFESDKLRAVAGCFNIISRRKSVEFICGLPSVDFHYALVWGGEQLNDHHRHGFPTWSWAAWSSMWKDHWLSPLKGTSGRMKKVEGSKDLYEHELPQTLEVELRGRWMRGVGGLHRPNRCMQKLAALRVNMKSSSLRVISEVAHFSVYIAADPNQPELPKAPGLKYEVVPADIDTESASSAYLSSLTPDVNYRIHERLRFRTSAIDDSKEALHGWPSVMTDRCPSTLRGSTLTWLLREGIDIVSIIEIEWLGADSDIQKSLPLRRLLCIGIDRSKGVAQRLGVFWISRELWDQARPRETVVDFY
ncbi:heterokaryon incompatibility protein-domain-containing protein [Xylaria arbuscula]|nr:heterokaryon incompatibility protein-domain-containing protein [Xylaria arbuscula]